MNILYYHPSSVKLPHCEDSENDEISQSTDSAEEDHFISIGAERGNKGRMIDVYVSWVADFESKMILNINQ